MIILKRQNKKKLLILNPQTVGGNFDCSNSLNLHSLDSIEEVKGKTYKDF